MHSLTSALTLEAHHSDIFRSSTFATPFFQNRYRLGLYPIHPQPPTASPSTPNLTRWPQSSSSIEDPESVTITIRTLVGV